MSAKSGLDHTTMVSSRVAAVAASRRFWCPWCNGANLPTTRPCSNEGIGDLRAAGFSAPHAPAVDRHGEQHELQTELRPELEVVEVHRLQAVDDQPDRPAPDPLAR